ncbi:BspA family leucine-rich repeat surface protein [Levilactobacillus enshiensis]|uniref:BspA family leucine-rich repeat surface protein n=1 Tax=Levilactobacillus enshiensis TaxID=2590213 RepID=UPI0011799AF7|nr:BspA family leucine-rich repeat surface protein [Levilactobacillus enshiensis]
MRQLVSTKQSRHFVYMGITLASLSLGSLGLTTTAHADTAAGADPVKTSATVATPSATAAVSGTLQTEEGGAKGQFPPTTETQNGPEKTEQPGNQANTSTAPVGQEAPQQPEDPTAPAAATAMTGTFGTSAWNIDAAGVLHFGAGQFDEIDSNTNRSPWATNADQIKKISFDGPVVSGKSAAYLFAGLPNLTAVDHADQFDISQTTSLMRLFENDSSLVTVDTSNWNTSRVTDMFGMFEGAKSLVTVDVSHWNTSQVRDMQVMFEAAQSLTTLDVANWDTGHVTNMNGMFGQFMSEDAKDRTERGSLQALDVSHWNMSSIGTGNRYYGGSGGDIAFMFAGQDKLKTLDVSNWDVSHNRSLIYTFVNDSALETLDVSKWQTGDVSDMTGTFYGNTALTTLDISNWDVSKVLIMDYMFMGMPNVKQLDFSRWNTTGKIFFHMMNMLTGDAALTHLNLSGFHMNEAGQMYFNQFLAGTNLRVITMGEQTALTGKYLIAYNDYAGLPDISKMAGFDAKKYSGRWQAVGTGTLENPNGKSYTSVQLEYLYCKSNDADGSVVGPAETYVWQTNTVQITGTGTKVYDGRALSLNQFRIQTYGSLIAAPANGWQPTDLAWASDAAATRAAAPDLKNVGTYTATLSAAGRERLKAANPGLDDINIVDGTFTITKAPATITVNSQQVTYDGQAHQLTATVTGEVNSEKLAYELDTTPQTAAGTYTVTPVLKSAAVNQNYDVTLTPGTLTIQAATGHVHVHYVNESGQPIAPDHDQSAEVGTAYTLIAPTIPGAILISTPANVTGEFALAPVDATFVYHQFGPTNPDKLGRVSAHYLDETGKSIAADQTVVGSIGATYQLATQHPGYILVGGAANATGQYTEVPVDVTLIYHQLSSHPAGNGTVITHLVDEQGRPLAADQIHVGQTGTSYQLATPQLKGYLAVNTAATTGTFSNTATDATVVYHQLQNTAADHGLVITHYVDSNGQSLAPDTKQVGPTGSAYTLTAPTLTGYSVQNAATLTGTYTGTVTEQTFIYQKTTAPVIPVDPENPDVPTPPVTPVDPEQPVVPTPPVTPVNPEQPVTPVNPVKPTAPTTPEQPRPQHQVAQPADRVRPITQPGNGLTAAREAAKRQENLAAATDQSAQAVMTQQVPVTTLPQTNEATPQTTIWGWLLAGLTTLLGLVGWHQRRDTK